jgi:hypothetical protein
MPSRCKKSTSGQRNYNKRFQFVDVLINGAYTATERKLANQGLLNPFQHFDATTNVRLNFGRRATVEIERAVVAHRIFNDTELQEMCEIISRAQQGITKECNLGLADNTRGHRLAVGGGHM